MTDEDREPIENGTPEEGGSSRGWMADVQAAFDRAGTALNAAWDATRDTRVRAMEAAKRAVEELSEAVDRGVSVARERWAATGSREPEVPPPAGDAERTEPED